LQFFFLSYTSSQNLSLQSNLTEHHLTEILFGTPKQPQPCVMGSSSPVTVRLGQPVIAGHHLAIKQYSNAEWEVKREIIKQLYVDENKPLHEVMKVMESEHLFKAT
jgi:hypothetical protein